MKCNPCQQKTPKNAKPRPERANNPSPTQATRHVGKQARMRKITENRNPFGVLNLSKLIIKDLAHTGIILDSANNTIKVTRDSDGSGQIRVYEVCDENGDKCSSAAAIYNITNGAGAGDGISADGTTGDYCFLNTGGNLMCNNDALKKFVMELIEGTTPGGTRQPNLVNQDGYVTAPTASNANKVRKTDGSGNPGWREDATGGGNGVTYTAGTNITISNGVISATDTNTWQPNTKDQAGYVATGNGNANKVRKTDGSGNPGWREDATGGGDGVTYTAGTNITISNGVISATWQQNQRLQSGYVTAPGMQFLKCRKTDANGNPGWFDCGGGGNTYRKEVSFSNGSSTATPNGITQSNTVTGVTLKENNQYLYFGNTNNTIYYNTTLRIQKVGFSSATSPVLFHANGATFGYTNLARQTSVSGVSIAGELIVGNTGTTSNRIRVYSTGSNYAYPSGRHGEIRASNELAVGVMDGAFIYFKNIPTTTNNSLQKYRVGINTTTPATTLDVAGSIRVQDNPCVPNSCSETTVGSITFINNKFYGCKKNSNNIYGWHEFTMTDSNTNEIESFLVCQQQAAY